MKKYHSPKRPLKKKAAKKALTKIMPRKKVTAKKAVVKRVIALKSSRKVTAKTNPAQKRRKTAFVRSATGIRVRTVNTKDKPKFTGRQLVILNNAADLSSIQKAASGFSVKMATTRDFAETNASTISKALEQGDGIIFEKLKIAVINNQLEEPVRRMTMGITSKSPFIKSEPERYVYATLRASTKEKRELYQDKREATWGIDAMNVLNSQQTGKGINVAILDTGFDKSHDEFKGRIKGFESFVKGETAQDRHGHGSHCTGIATGDIRIGQGYRFGVAKEANVYIGKVLNDQGRGDDAGILAGIEWALENKCRVISMSLGGEAKEGEPFSESFESAANTAITNKCLIIAAAGNESNRPGSISPVNHPANCPSILSVAALDPALQVAYFSCVGSDLLGAQVDIAGPGVDILSCWSDGKWIKESGTSMATPFVAGLAAVYCEMFPDASPLEIWQKLVHRAKKLPWATTYDAGAGLAFYR